MYGIVYKVINTVNNKVYIGQTVHKLEVRKNRHVKDALIRTSNIYFHNAIRKYGQQNFKWVVLEHCDSKEELDEIEFHYIKQYNSIKPYGYNLTFGGEGSFGYKHSDSIKKKMSEASFSSDRHVNRGKHLSKEWRGKISLSHIGVKLTEEHRRKMSESRKGRFAGEDSKCSRKFVITTPTGEEFYIIGLANFSRMYKNGLLDFRLLSAVANGKRNHHKWFKCRHFDEKIDFNIFCWDQEK